MTSSKAQSKMAGFRDRDKQHFPLKSIDDVVDLLKDQLDNQNEPNLALLSIVFGAVENNLTVNRVVVNNNSCDQWGPSAFPVVRLSTVEALYHRFVCLVRGSIDLSVFDRKYATRELIKRVSDVIWAGLSRGSYKDKAHLQSLYSYLTGNKLDCFGLALAVVAACQQLGFSDVHMALSEDHAWVVFGPDGTDTAEVTWHGKGNEDKRGEPITSHVADKSWLYLNGHPVVCTRAMEVAAMVSGINPAINATMDSVEVGALMQKLLWQLYDRAHLHKYPMALGNLGDLEEITPTPGRPSPVQLFSLAIEATRTRYHNQHIYPYTYLGGYYFRKGMFKEAIRNWAGAAQAISSYNYNREDEEIYKEFLEIANEFIPHIIKLCLDSSASGPVGSGGLLSDPHAYSMLLSFYDGICQWEEGSSTPVLHITWANHLFHSLSKFNGTTREGVAVEKDEEDGDEEECSEKEVEECSEAKRPRRRDRRECSKENMGEAINPRASRTGFKAKETVLEAKPASSPPPPLTPPPAAEEEEAKIKTTIEELASKVGDSSPADDPVHPNIADLAKACGEGILNPDYLLGMGEPFTTAPDTPAVVTPATDSRPLNELLSSQSDGTAFAENNLVAVVGPPEGGKLKLRSAKMRGLKRLLLSQKLNANAIKLQLTAQSQVHLKHSKVGSADFYGVGTRKRMRRD